MPVVAISNTIARRLFAMFLAIRTVAKIRKWLLYVSNDKPCQTS